MQRRMNIELLLLMMPILLKIYEFTLQDVNVLSSDNECFRYTDRRQSAINHFNQALSLDPLLWAAYEELCILGVFEEN